MSMDWQEKLGDLVLGGLAGTLGSALPEHWRRRVRERLGDFNPYNVIAGNHDLLRAARHLAERIHAAGDSDAWTAVCRLVAVKWLAVEISPSVRELLQTLPKSGTLPDLPTTGWEETFLLAAAMVNQPDAFLRTLEDFNLPLAGHCAAQTDVAISEGMRAELQHALINRSRDPATDLRARINAGHALGALGDPRFKRLEGSFGAFLLPPIVAIPGGIYAIGSDEGIFENEAPRHSVSLEPFWLGQFPVTNAEFCCFIDAGWLSGCALVGYPGCTVLATRGRLR